MKLFAGSSALMRTSIECPRMSMSDWSNESFFPAADADHLGEQINAGYAFGDRMLDLNAGVHFDEMEFTGLVIEEIFNCAGAPVIDGRRKGDGGGTKRIAYFR